MYKFLCKGITHPLNLWFEFLLPRATVNDSLFIFNFITAILTSSHLTLKPLFSLLSAIAVHIKKINYVSFKFEIIVNLSLLERASCQSSWLGGGTPVFKAMIWPLHGHSEFFWLPIRFRVGWLCPFFLSPSWTFKVFLSKFLVPSQNIFYRVPLTLSSRAQIPPTLSLSASSSQILQHRLEYLLFYILY